MNRHLAAVLLVGCTFLASSDAIMNLLGPTVNFPLINWDAQRIIMVITNNQTIMQDCRQNNISPSVLASKSANIMKCSSKMTGLVSGGGQVPDPSQMCSAIREFTTCVLKEAMDLADVCKTNEDKKMFIENTIKNNRAMSKEMCADNAKLIMDFGAKGGMSCQHSMGSEFKKCATDNTMANMKYDKKGCMAAWKFVDCINTKMGQCKLEAAPITYRIMSKGLNATPCKTSTEAGSATVTAQIVSILSCVFAAKFI